MGWFDWLKWGSDIAKPIEAVSKLYTTEKERLKETNALQATQNAPILGQQDINKIYAGSASFFKSSWQPLTGWTAGACLVLYYVPQLVIADYFWVKGCLDSGHLMPFPIPPDNLLYLISLMFGFGCYHLADKKINK